MNPPTARTPPQTRDRLGAPQLTLIEHLDELRRRLLVCGAALLVASGVALWRVEWLVEWLKRPAGNLIPRLAFFSPTEALFAYMKVGLGCGAVLALPVILYQVWGFVRPGLTQRERWSVLAFVWWGSVLFAVGAALGYRVCLPLFLRFLLTIGSSTLEPVLSVSRYVSFTLGVLLTCGALFELPLILFILTRLGILTPQTLRRRRSMAILVLLIITAVVTPTTDALSLIVMTIPLVALYELSIIVAGFAAKSSR